MGENTSLPKLLQSCELFGWHFIGIFQCTTDELQRACAQFVAVLRAGVLRDPSGS